MKNSIINLGLLQMFLALAKHGRVKEAAEELGVTSPAVTQGIARLEDFLQTELFDHTMKPLQLTVAGRVLAQEGQKLIDSSVGLYALLKTNPLSSLRLVLGLSESASLTIGPWLMAKMLATKSQLTIRSSFVKPLMDDLKLGRFDAVISPEPLFHEKDVYRLPLWEEDYILVLPPDAPVIPNVATLRAYAADHPRLQFNSYSYDRQQTSRYFRSLGVVSADTIEVESSYTMAGLVAKGFGWAMMTPLNVWLGRDYVNGLHLQPLVGQQCVRTQWLLSVKPLLGPVLHEIALQSQQALSDFMDAELSSVSQVITKSIRLPHIQDQAMRN